MEQHKLKFEVVFLSTQRIKDNIPSTFSSDLGSTTSKYLESFLVKNVRFLVENNIFWQSHVDLLPAKHQQ